MVNILVCPEFQFDLKQFYQGVERLSAPSFKEKKKAEKAPREFSIKCFFQGRQWLPILWISRGCSPSHFPGRTPVELVTDCSEHRVKTGCAKTTCCIDGRKGVLLQVLLKHLIS